MNEIKTEETYRYKISKTEGGSNRYGVCEVCGGHCDTTYYQIEEKKYQHGWTQHECNSLFGHKGCLIKNRKKI